MVVMGRWRETKHQHEKRRGREEKSYFKKRGGGEGSETMIG